MSDWLQALGDAVERSSQSRVGERIGYSASTVSLVLNGRYKGDLRAVEAAVRAQLMLETVDCPALGLARRSICGEMTNPNLPPSGMSRMVQQFCASCQHNPKGGRDE